MAMQIMALSSEYTNPCSCVTALPECRDVLAGLHQQALQNGDRNRGGGECSDYRRHRNVSLRMNHPQAGINQHGDNLGGHTRAVHPKDERNERKHQLLPQP